MLEKAQGSLLHQAIAEGFITDDTVSIYEAHFKLGDPHEVEPHFSLLRFD